VSTALAREDESSVHDAIAALEIAEGVVPAGAFAALRDPALRRHVGERLAACGRVLIPVGDDWVSGYDDAVADQLIARGYGMLTTADRAVLALVLLRTVAIPRARGEVTGDAWTSAEGARSTSIDELAQNRHVSKTQIGLSVRRLRTLGVLRPGHRVEMVPGPALTRLTPQRAAWLWEDLLLLAAPDSPYAQVLRRRRSGSTARRVPREHIAHRDDIPDPLDIAPEETS
jgi:hypothetical protein